MPDPPVNPELRRAVFDIVRNQIARNDPPETKQTLERLQAEGHSKAKAMDLLACVVINEIVGVMNEGRPFNKKAYVAALHGLPDMPPEWDD